MKPRISQQQAAKRDEQSKIARSRAAYEQWAGTLQGAEAIRTAQEFSAKWRAEADAIEAQQKAKR